MAVAGEITGGLVHLSGNPIQVTLTANAVLNNHRLAVKISCAGLLSPVQVEEYEPVDLVAKCDIHGLVNEPLASEFDFPAVGKVTAHNALALIVTLDFGEVYTDASGDRQESWNVDNIQIRVLNGEFRNYELQLLNDAGKSFASEYIDGGKFLTNLPDNLKVAPTQIIKLWYLSRWAENTNAVLHMSVRQMTNYGPHWYDDVISEDLVLYANGLFEFNVNPFHFGYDAIHPVTSQYPILEYKFWLTKASDATVISEVRNFVVDNKPYEVQYFGLYRNKFSAIDPVWLKGSAKEGLSTESETAYKPLPVGSGTKVPSMITVSSSGQRSWEINTGVKIRTEMLALRDFLEAKERWLIDPDNTGKLIPVVIESGSYILNDSMEALQDTTIKLFEAHKK